MGERPKPGTVRIIAGEWRSRRLPVADVPGLRPSGDRVRETLFNWLQSELPGAVCADLYAGSGALGFEAASRGAKNVVLVERHPFAVEQLEKNIRTLEAQQVTLHPGDVMDWLQGQPQESYDLLFADPPFAEHLHEALLDAVQRSECLKPGGLLYLESPASEAAPTAPKGWRIRKDKRIGDVRLQLVESGDEATR